MGNFRYLFYFFGGEILAWILVRFTTSLAAFSFFGGSNGTIHVLSKSKTTCNADFVELPKVECFNSHLLCVFFIEIMLTCTKLGWLTAGFHEAWGLNKKTPAICHWRRP